MLSNSTLKLCILLALVTNYSNSFAASNSSSAGGLSTEVQERIAADNAINLRIDNEEQARIAADAATNLRIDSEEQARIATDAAINLRIDNIQLTPGPQGEIGPQGPAGEGMAPANSQGDMLYWDGYSWNLIEAPLNSTNSVYVLKFINGKPTWVSDSQTGLNNILASDPNPPSGWVQCAGFVNTEADDIPYNFFDNCQNSTAIRVRVYNEYNELVEDVYSTDLTPSVYWPDWGYLGGTTSSFIKTNWGSSSFYTTKDGRDPCGMQYATNGAYTFGTANRAAIISGGALDDAREYSINCGGPALLNHTIYMYKQQ